MTTKDDAAPAAGSTGLSRGVTLTMAIACGLAVANIYYNQPLLGILARDFGNAPLVGFVPTATQLGYALGIILLVPLGDTVQRRTMILWQIAAMSLALLGLTLAPTPGTLLAASGLLGLTASIAQQIIPFAADLAGPLRRGSVIGTVMSGLLCGILLGRTVAGVIGSAFGWRAVFGLSIVAAAGMALALGLVLPRQPPRARMSYPALLASLWGLWRDEPRLRRAALTQTALFASFSAFWSVLALKLEAPPYHLGAEVAGLFGLLGTAGALAAPILGRLADRRGPRVGIVVGAALSIAAWMLMGLSLSMAALVGAVLLLDVGMQGGMISNQHIIFALRPEAGSRINTVFVGLLFLGASAGSALASLAWYHGGWTAVSLLGGLFAALALGLQLAGRGDAATGHG